jgi:dolichol-phosphate mannosyltransferase
LPYQAGRQIVKILVAIPTYNEALNIEPFIKAVFENIPPEGEILVIDDNSPDGTAKIVENLIHDYPRRLHILNRPEKQGLPGRILQPLTGDCPATMTSSLK